jgi:hypothetical protein
MRVGLRIVFEVALDIEAVGEQGVVVGEGDLDGVLE